MTKFIHLISLIVLIIGCNGPIESDMKNSEKQDTVAQLTNGIAKRNPIDYVKNYNGEDNKLFSFVGLKISLDTLPKKSITFMDRGFVAKYLVLQRVFGEFLYDTIEFVVYDHLGIPKFSEFEYVLLFVTADSGTYYHQKYLYADVYLTKNEKWAGAYDESIYNHENNKKTKVKPVKIDFASEVLFPVSIYVNNGKRVADGRPKPYYKIVDDKALAVYGNYVDDLFILYRDGYLTDREIFKDGKLIE